jgi:putative spermidine/putrescine transport system ATP-binding protein
MTTARDGRHSLPITLDRVTKRYGAVTAVEEVTLEIGAGEFVTLLGPSGSGKTTLLNILSGFIRLNSGRVLFGDEDVTLLPPHRRNVGLVFQNYALFPHMTVFENVAFPLKARKVPKAEAAERVRWALDLVRLGDFGPRRADQLSGGQRQRVALARAVVFEPKIILMDEPLSALDKKLREHMQIELRHLHEQIGATTVYVTHDQREALTMSDRIAVLNLGRLVQMDTPERLYERPVDSFVADFVGESTLLPVTRVGERAVRLGEATLRTTEPLPAGDELLLVLRTEKLVAGADRSDANLLRGHVAERVYQGESVLLFVDLGGGVTVGMRRPTRADSLEALPGEGEEIVLALHPDNTIVVPGGGAAIRADADLEGARAG